MRSGPAPGVAGFLASAGLAGIVGLAAVPGGAGAEALAVDPESCRRAIEYSDRNRGGSVLVMIGDQVVCEAYGEGFGPDTAFHLASATKSFWGVAAAAMVADGLLRFDERAADTLTEWRDDPRRSRITVRQLLSLQSGLEEDIPAIQGEGNVADKYAHAVGLRAEREPGEAFRYGPSNFYVLGEVMRRKLAGRAKDPLAYLESRILAPIGLEHGPWQRDRAGNPHLPNGAHLTARQWAKLGRLVLQEGRWEGRQLVPAELLAECFAPSPANPGYGLTWWLNRPGGFDTQARPAAPGSAAGFIYPDGYPDLAGALGAGPNRMWLVPSLDLLAIRQVPSEIRPAEVPWGEWLRQNRWRAEFSDAVFLRLLLTGKREAGRGG